MIAFFGTPEFAAVHLEGLLDAGFDVGVVVTRPDRARGRGRRVSPSPVKALAVARGIEVLTPRGAREAGFTERMIERGVELLVVVAYGSILPASLLEAPRLGAVNLHASLLPRWRGAAPVQRAIAAGDRLSGVTSMFMDEGVDTGDIILSRETPIGPDENAGELLARLAPLGRDTLVETVRLVLEGRAPRTAQDDECASLAPRLSKEEGWIRWEASAEEIARLVRAMTPWPGARARLREQTATLLAARAVEGRAEAGAIAPAEHGGLLVGTGRGLLRIESLKMPGRRQVSGDAFARGARLRAGERFDASPPQAQ